MVISKTTNILLVFLFLLISSFSSNEALSDTTKLFLFLEENNYTLGRPIRAELYGIGLQRKITNIDLSQLDKNFGVLTEYSVSDTRDQRWPNQSIQILKLKLYPRYTGKIIIPYLSMNGSKTKKKEIQVKIGKTGNPKVSLSVNNPYERQQFILSYSIRTDDATSRLSIKEDYKVNGFESASLPFSRKKESDGTYTNKIGWALTALQSGEQLLDLPPIEYSISGVRRKQFYLPHETISIKPLPSYIPPTLPIGEISLQSEPPYSWLIQTNTLTYWNINIKGNMNNAYRLPAILRQITSNAQFQFLPVNSKHSSEISNDTLISSTNHSIPFKALSSGFLKLPDLTIQYFDPNKGEIKNLKIESKRIFVLGIFWQVVLGSLMIYVIYTLFKFTLNKFIKLKTSADKRNQALRTLLKVKCSSDIKDSIHLIAESECWPKNTTISQWGLNWKEKYKINNKFDDLLQATSSLFYGRESNADINELSLELYNLIKNRKRC